MNESKNNEEREKIMKRLGFVQVLYPSGNGTVMFWKKHKVPYSSQISDKAVSDLIELVKCGAKK